MLSNLDSKEMWSREGIQQFMHRGAAYTQKGIHMVEQGVQYAGMIKAPTRLGVWPSAWGDRCFAWDRS